tara:strand:+ start:77 stop:763 length:687 start_codon:yes stop_codon:yes gene_type:complete
MPYPLVIKDNFFPDPDSILESCNQLDCNRSHVNFPGLRTNYLSDTNKKLFLFIANRIFALIHDKTPDAYNMDMRFQKIKPFVEDDKWDKKNRGWVHKDCCLFGGVIYLDKNPDKDAGTSIYESKYGYDVQTDESLFHKEHLHSGKLMDDGQYYEAYDMIADQYEETLRIPNLYNRLVLIPGDQPHAMTTTGDKERHTIAFFCYDTMGVSLPEYKRNPTVAIPNHALYT